MSFPPGTEMFQFPRFASCSYVFRTGYPHGWVSPFGHPRIIDRSHLPAAYRSVPRPSSPLGAKASTERSYRAQSPPPPARRTKTHAHPLAEARPGQLRMIVTAAAKTRLSHTHSHTYTNQSRVTCQTTRPRPAPQKGTAASGEFRDAVTPPENQSPRAGHQNLETVGIEPTTPCLQSRCSPTELRPLNPQTGPEAPAEWAREDLNLRPHAYQACALTN